MDRAWGNGNTINLHFSEPLLPTTALEMSHYAVEKDGGGKVVVTNVSFGPGNHSVILTTAEPLEAAETYSVTTRNLTDRANLALVEPKISFDTWDDDPRVIKGGMTVGYGSGPDCIGPEFGFAWSVHQVLDGEPVLVIKAAWGGKSLHSDFRSPSAAAERDVPIGPYYLQMMASVRLACEQMGEDFPEFKGKGYHRLSVSATTKATTTC